MPRFRIGSRGSPLALAQAHMVRDALIATLGWSADELGVVVIKTTGDKVQDRPLAEIGGKALWTKELDVALLAGEIDCAVHSMKDVETIRPEAITIAAMLEREDVRDRIVGADSIAALKQGAVVGTSSPRRAAQVRRLRPDVRTVSFRGNVDTRLAKLAAGEADATLLASAGLRRLERNDVGTPIELSEMLPAASQGAVGIECRVEDLATREFLSTINHEITWQCVMAERAFLAALHADCHSPVGAYATAEHGTVRLRGELLSEDGAAHVAGEHLGDDAPERLARELLDRAPAEIRRLFAA